MKQKTPHKEGSSVIAEGFEPSTVCLEAALIPNLAKTKIDIIYCLSMCYIYFDLIWNQLESIICLQIVCKFFC
ncbi:MAG: hypothetical protein CML05_03890 [Pseudozobellia sp.]|nr:hypothetical protein [Pseudozobellia sp.]